MTKADEIKAVLAEVRARADAATPGPWKRDYEVYYGLTTADCKAAAVTAQIEGYEQVIAKQPSSIDKDLTTQNEIFANGAFIAAARTDVPRLVRALEAAVEALEFYSKGGNFNTDVWQHPDLGFFTGKRAASTLAQVADALGGKRE